MKERNSLDAALRVTGQVPRRPSEVIECCSRLDGIRVGDHELQYPTAHALELPATPPIRVILVDDQQLFRIGLHQSGTRVGAAQRAHVHPGEIPAVPAEAPTVPIAGSATFRPEL